MVYTEWSMFFIFNRQGLAPYFVIDQNSGQGENDFLECSLLAESRTGGNDFWRVSRDGLGTLIRGYFEDRRDASAELRTNPGSFLSPNWMVRDIAEFVRHARALAERFPDATAVNQSAFTAAPVCARQRAPRRMLAGGAKGRTH